MSILIWIISIMTTDSNGDNPQPEPNPVEFPPTPILD